MTSLYIFLNGNGILVIQLRRKRVSVCESHILLYVIFGEHLQKLNEEH